MEDGDIPQRQRTDLTQKIDTGAINAALQGLSQKTEATTIVASEGVKTPSTGIERMAIREELRNKDVRVTIIYPDFAGATRPESEIAYRAANIRTASVPLGTIADQVRYNSSVPVTHSHDDIPTAVDSIPIEQIAYAGLDDKAPVLDRSRRKEWIGQLIGGQVVGVTNTTTIEDSFYAQIQEEFGDVRGTDPRYPLRSIATGTSDIASTIAKSLPPEFGSAATREERAEMIRGVYEYFARFLRASHEADMIAKMLSLDATRRPASSLAHAANRNNLALPPLLQMRYGINATVIRDFEPTPLQRFLFEIFPPRDAQNLVREIDNGFQFKVDLQEIFRKIDEQGEGAYQFVREEIELRRREEEELQKEQPKQIGEARIGGYHVVVNQVVPKRK